MSSSPTVQHAYLEQILHGHSAMGEAVNEDSLKQPLGIMKGPAGSCNAENNTTTKSSLNSCIHLASSCPDGTITECFTSFHPSLTKDTPRLTNFPKGPPYAGKELGPKVNPTQTESLQTCWPFTLALHVHITSLSCVKISLAFPISRTNKRISFSCKVLILWVLF